MSVARITSRDPDGRFAGERTEGRRGCRPR
jgi:hypothetical protein